MKLVLGVVLCLAMLAGPAGAQAAQRYAAPNGGGTACTQAAPCALADAVGGASNGDEVIVTAGEYSVSEPLGVPAGAENVSIHGDFGAPMPKVSAALGGQPLIFVREQTSLTYLELLNTETEASGFRCFDGALVERVRATGDGEGAAGGVALGPCTIRDSVLRANGTNALGMETSGVVGEDASIVRNVTAIATGFNSIGIQSRYSYPSTGSHQMILSNSIAAGAAFDLRAEDGSFGPGSIAVSNSNFDSISQEGAATISGPANQTALPLFVNAAAGDYREAAGSPTIDAGSAAGIGALDLAGNPRLLGAAPDIGAFELVPPPAAALTALTISPRSFRARGAGEAIVSKARQGKKGGATVRYAITAAASVTFSVERALRGRRVGGKCRKQTAANRGRKRCARFKALRGAFSLQGVTGANAFRFSGRLRGKALKPGRYRLVAQAGVSTMRANFKILD